MNATATETLLSSRNLMHVRARRAIGEAPQLYTDHELRQAIKRASRYVAGIEQTKVGTCQPKPGQSFSGLKHQRVTVVDPSHQKIVEQILNRPLVWREVSPARWEAEAAQYDKIDRRWIFVPYHLLP